ncbi:50S ribosomal protein L21 [bacterium endosymbiont of Pedicinus badii]|uniref:50S ribosomal protein L21 n=1 Tax=bacterium endosymbiont of Pedicinus badii TaxID=1719126 RepID=UPI0009BB5127|nr:50S ribosomal protein L21 [bacterium endosymbiont of Pedicinus badii]OQM34184.1 hypothetical protein AOQ89_02505 [bacterium endosymbiont of Pedicinus badii]
MKNSIYVIFEYKNQQYRCCIGEKIKINKIIGEIGEKIVFKKVLFFSINKDIEIGNPYLNKKIFAKVLKIGKEKKIIILKFKRRKHFKKKMGYRQKFTLIKIENFI